MALPLRKTTLQSKSVEMRVCADLREQLVGIADAVVEVREFQLREVLSLCASLSLSLFPHLTLVLSLYLPLILSLALSHSLALPRSHPLSHPLSASSSLSHSDRGE